MQFGLSVPTFGEYGDLDVLVGLAVDAEEAGWDGFWLWDHLQWTGQSRQRAVDTTVALSLVAQATRRVRIGPMLLPMPRRRPWKVARELTTLDHLSRGRLTAGVGLGYPPDLEYADLGEPSDPRIRAEKLDEGLAILTRLWSGEPTSYSGRHFTLSDVQLIPGPVQPRPPIWVGGTWPGSPRPFRRAARFDGVFPNLVGVTLADQPAAIARLVSLIGALRAADAAPFAVAHGAETSPDQTDADRELVAAFADVGVTWWMEPVSADRAPIGFIRDRIRSGPPQIA